MRRRKRCSKGQKVNLTERSTAFFLKQTIFNCSKWFLKWLKERVFQKLINLFSQKNKFRLGVRNGYVAILLAIAGPALIWAVQWGMKNALFSSWLIYKKDANTVYKKCATAVAFEVAKHFNASFSFDKQKFELFKVAADVYNQYPEHFSGSAGGAIPGLERPDEFNKSLLSVKSSTSMDTKYSVVAYTTPKISSTVTTASIESDNYPHYLFYKNIDAVTNESSRPFLGVVQKDVRNNIIKSVGLFESFADILGANYIAKDNQEVAGPYLTSTAKQYTYNWSKTPKIGSDGASIIEYTKNSESDLPYASDPDEKVKISFYMSGNGERKIKAEVKEIKLTVKKNEETGQEETTKNVKYDTAYAIPAKCNVDIVLSIPTNAAACNPSNTDASLTDITNYIRGRNTEETTATIKNAGLDGIYPGYEDYARNSKKTPIFQISRAYQKFLKDNFLFTRGVSVGIIPYSGKVTLRDYIKNSSTTDSSGDTTTSTSDVTKDSEGKSYKRSDWFIKFPTFVPENFVDDIGELERKHLPVVRGSTLYGTKGKKGESLYVASSEEPYDYSSNLYGTALMFRRGISFTKSSEIKIPDNKVSGSNSTDTDTKEEAVLHGGNPIFSGNILSNADPTPNYGKNLENKFFKMNMNPCYMGYANLLGMQCEKDCKTYMPNPYYIIELTSNVQKIIDMLSAFYPFYDDRNASSFSFIPITWANNLFQKWMDDPSVVQSSDVKGGGYPIESKRTTGRKKAVILMINKPDNFESSELTYLGFNNDYAELHLSEADKIDFSNPIVDGNYSCGYKKILKFNKTNWKNDAMNTGEACLFFPEKGRLKVKVSGSKDSYFQIYLSSDKKKYITYYMDGKIESSVGVSSKALTTSESSDLMKTINIEPSMIFEDNKDERSKSYCLKCYAYNLKFISIEFSNTIVTPRLEVYQTNSRQYKLRSYNGRCPFKITVKSTTYPCSVTFNYNACLTGKKKRITTSIGSQATITHTIASPHNESRMTTNNRQTYTKLTYQLNNAEITSASVTNRVLRWTPTWQDDGISLRDSSYPGKVSFTGNLIEDEKFNKISSEDQKFNNKSVGSLGTINAGTYYFSGSQPTMNRRVGNYLKLTPHFRIIRSVDTIKHDTGYRRTEENDSDATKKKLTSSKHYLAIRNDYFNRLKSRESNKDVTVSAYKDFAFNYRWNEWAIKKGNINADSLIIASYTATQNSLRDYLKARLEIDHSWWWNNWRRYKYSFWWHVFWYWGIWYERRWRHKVEQEINQYSTDEIADDCIRAMGNGDKILHCWAERKRKHWYSFKKKWYYYPDGYYDLIKNTIEDWYECKKDWYDWRDWWRGRGGHKFSFDDCKYKFLYIGNNSRNYWATEYQVNFGNYYTKVTDRKVRATENCVVDLTNYLTWSLPEAISGKVKIQYHNSVNHKGPVNSWNNLNANGTDLAYNTTNTTAEVAINSNTPQSFYVKENRATPSGYKYVYDRYYNDPGYYLLVSTTDWPFPMQVADERKKLNALYDINENIEKVYKKFKFLWFTIKIPTWRRTYTYSPKGTTYAIKEEGPSFIDSYLGYLIFPLNDKTDIASGGKVSFYGAGTITLNVRSTSQDAKCHIKAGEEDIDLTIKAGDFGTAYSKTTTFEEGAAYLKKIFSKEEESITGKYYEATVELQNAQITSIEALSTGANGTTKLGAAAPRIEWTEGGTSVKSCNKKLKFTIYARPKFGSSVTFSSNILNLGGGGGEKTDNTQLFPEETSVKFDDLKKYSDNSVETEKADFSNSENLQILGKTVYFNYMNYTKGKDGNEESTADSYKFIIPSSQLEAINGVSRNKLTCIVSNAKLIWTVKDQKLRWHGGHIKQEGDGENVVSSGWADEGVSLKEGLSVGLFSSSTDNDGNKTYLDHSLLKTSGVITVDHWLAEAIATSQQHCSTIKDCVAGLDGDLGTSSVNVDEITWKGKDKITLYEYYNVFNKLTSASESAEREKYATMMENAIDLMECNYKSQAEKNTEDTTSTTESTEGSTSGTTEGGAPDTTEGSTSNTKDESDENTQLTTEDVQKRVENGESVSATDLALLNTADGNSSEMAEALEIDSIFKIKLLKDKITKINEDTLDALAMQRALNQMIEKVQKGPDAVPAESENADASADVNALSGKTYEEIINESIKEILIGEENVEKIQTAKKALKEALTEMLNAALDTVKSVVEGNLTSSSERTTGQEATSSSKGTTGQEATGSSEGTTGQEATGSSEGTTGQEATSSSKGTTGQEIMSSNEPTTTYIYINFVDDSEKTNIEEKINAIESAEKWDDFVDKFADAFVALWNACLEDSSNIGQTDEKLDKNDLISEIKKENFSLFNYLESKAKEKQNRGKWNATVSDSYQATYAFFNQTSQEISSFGGTTETWWSKWSKWFPSGNRNGKGNGKENENKQLGDKYGILKADNKELDTNIKTNLDIFRNAASVEENMKKAIENLKNALKGLFDLDTEMEDEDTTTKATYGGLKLSDSGVTDNEIKDKTFNEVLAEINSSVTFVSSFRLLSRIFDKGLYDLFNDLSVSKIKTYFNAPEKEANSETSTEKTWIKSYLEGKQEESYDSFSSGSLNSLKNDLSSYVGSISTQINTLNEGLAEIETNLGTIEDTNAQQEDNKKKMTTIKSNLDNFAVTDSNTPSIYDIADLKVKLQQLQNALVEDEDLPEKENLFFHQSLDWLVNNQSSSVSLMYRGRITWLFDKAFKGTFTLTSKKVDSTNGSNLKYLTDKVDSSTTDAQLHIKLGDRAVKLNDVESDTYIADTLKGETDATEGAEDFSASSLSLANDINFISLFQKNADESGTKITSFELSGISDGLNEEDCTIDATRSNTSDGSADVTVTNDISFTGAGKIEMTVTPMEKPSISVSAVTKEGTAGESKTWYFNNPNDVVAIDIDPEVYYYRPDGNDFWVDTVCNNAEIFKIEVKDISDSNPETMGFARRFDFSTANSLSNIIARDFKDDLRYSGGLGKLNDKDQYYYSKSKIKMEALNYGPADANMVFESEEGSPGKHNWSGGDELASYENAPGFVRKFFNIMKRSMQQFVEFFGPKTTKMMFTDFTYPVNAVLMFGYGEQGAWTYSGWQAPTGTTKLYDQNLAVSHVTRDACDKLKADFSNGKTEDVRIYVVKYRAPDEKKRAWSTAGTETSVNTYDIIDGCASKKDYVYSANTRDELEEALQKIADDIKEFAGYEKATCLYEMM